MRKIYIRLLTFKKANKRRFYIMLTLLIFGNSLMCQATEYYHFKLPAMKASASLDKLATISGYSLIYPFDDSVSIVTNPLFGRYSMEEALAKILLNTPLSATATQRRVIAVSFVLNNYSNSTDEIDIKILLQQQIKQEMNTMFTEFITLPPRGFPVGSNHETKKSSPPETERIQIIGSRRVNRSPSDALAPLDLIDKQDLLKRGNSDIISTISNVVPSYNATQEAISDAGTMVRPASLRGLPTDSLLILVNGKRRHRSGVIYEFISGINVGAHGVDLEPIPSIALKRVEVLRDGAAAQYGSDAIAGVINFQLENNTDVNRLQLRSGQYYEGDGTKVELSGMLGRSIGDRGSANFSFELSESDATSRGVQDPAVQDLIKNGVSKHDIQEPVVIWGAPNITDNIKLFGNVEIDIGGNADYKELYLFGNWAQRDIDASFYYRNPNTRTGVFINQHDGTRIFFDMTDDNTGGCPVSTIPSSPNDAQTLAAVAANPGCFSFNERFPGGFTPRFGGQVTDKSLAAGIRGAFDISKAELTYDISLVLGRNHIDYDLHNSVNASLGENSPSDFRLGSQIQTDRMFNVDFTYPVDIGFQSEFNIAFGYQHYFEQFEVVAGEQAAYEMGPFSSSGQTIGANGFPGFSPETSHKNDRTSNALYLDIEGEATKNLSLSLAMRFEDIGQIANTFDGKMSARLQVNDAIALRSTLSSGFRAPTVGQSTLERISTSNSVVDGAVTQQISRLVSALSPIATARSGGKLKSETATSFSLGFLSEIGPVNLTLDYFYIEVDDRLSLFSSDIMASDIPYLSAADIQSNVTNIQYYANDFNSKTQGVDLVINAPLELLGTNDLVSLAVNYTDTELFITNPKSPISNINDLKEREQGIPNTRAVLTYAYSQGDINAVARINYYGSFYNAQFNDVSLIEKVDPVVITDMEFSYNMTDSLVVALGAKNIFNVYPQEYSEGRTAGFLGAIYPLNSPSGFNGGHYYLRMGWNF